MEKQEGRSADVCAGSSDILKRLVPAAVSSSQDGEQAASEGPVSEQESAVKRKSWASETRPPKAAEELPRLSFHIPRKSKERKALFQHIPAGSREFEDVVKILCSSYRDNSSAGMFSYTRARLVHSELLEKDFVEKRRELKQEGRTDKELSECYCFLLPDPSKIQWICEKGLSVGHSRVALLGNPAMGVYLSNYSDLLDMNPFDLGATGEIIIFKVMKGRVKSIYENVGKSVLDPTPKFDCHVSKNAPKVTSVRSYRAFELTQQYFYEYSFDEIRSRPRHVCPYAVVSFVYKGKENTPPPKLAPHLRSNSTITDGLKGSSGYLVWNGQLLNAGKVVYHVGLQSSTSPFLPFKLPDKLEIGTVIGLDQVKRKIPAALFSWDTYSRTREVMQSGLHCSLYEVLNRSRQGNGLTALLQKLERDRVVLVNTLIDRGFLFLLSSAQMVAPHERRADWKRCLLALFVFQEPRRVTKFCFKRSAAQEPACEAKERVLDQLGSFVPALHYALMKVRANPPADLAAGVQRQARDYLSGCASGRVRGYRMGEYQQGMDEHDGTRGTPKLSHNKERYLRAYLYGPASYLLALQQAREIVESCRCPPEYSPVSDWEGSDSQPADGKQGAARSNGAHGPLGAHADNDPEKMKELLKLIQMCKRNFEGEGRQAGEAQDGVEQGVWGARSMKRKLELGDAEGPVKYLRTEPLDNGEQGRDGAQKCPSLAAVVSSMGLCDTDLRKGSAQGSSRLMSVLSSADKPQSASVSPRPSREGHNTSEAASYDVLARLGLPVSAPYNPGPQSRGTEEEQGELSRSDCLEEQTAGSLSSLEVFSPGSSGELPRGTELLAEEQIPWHLIPLTDEEPLQALRHTTGPEGSEHGAHAGAEGAQPQRGSSSVHKEVFSRLDGILEQEFGEFSAEIRNVLKEERVDYTPELQAVARWQCQWVPALPFSEYVLDYVSPVPVQSYVNTLRERMSHVIDSEVACSGSAVLPCPAAAPATTATPAAAPVLQPPAPPPSPPASHALPHNPQEVPLQESAMPGLCVKQDPEPRRPARPEPEPAAVRNADEASRTPPATGTASNPISSLISQLKPEMFSSLVEIIKDVQKNAVKFYIHSEEKNDICVEIKEYLVALGNTECKPQSFLDSKSKLDKLLIIIQNEDIAAHVHKIPALVSLKKLPSVSFAGVDSLDDVKNHTYNELFVSGGFIVSDEFVLNPDFITHGRLQAFLKFLEEQSTPESLWHWKVHCKSQKKLKELGRLNGDALSLLNLLAAYQKRHLVEFLPYHECDGPSRHAPDLDCLIRLQAQHTQHRHTIFLTERQFEMFPQYTNNGIVIASIDGIMNSFHSLTGFHDGDDEVLSAGHIPAPENDTEVKDACVEEEDMSLDSDDDPGDIEEPGPELHEGDTGPQPPQGQQFQPPLPDVVHMDPAVPASSVTPQQVDLDTLQTAISHFGSSPASPMDYELGGVSPGAFNVNPHQSFLCSATLPTSSSSSSGAQTCPVSPCSALQEQDGRSAGSTTPPGHLLPVNQGDVTPVAPALAPPLLKPGGGAGGPAPSLCSSQDPACLGAVNSSGGVVPSPLAAPPSSPALGQQAASSGAVSFFPMGCASSWSKAGEASSSMSPADPEERPLGPGNGVGQEFTSLISAGIEGAGKSTQGNSSSTYSNHGSVGELPRVAGLRAELGALGREAPKGMALLPTPPRLAGINGQGRGGGIGPSLFDNILGESGGPRGPSLKGPRVMLRPGQERGGHMCTWRFPQGRGAPRGPSPNFTQDSYPWREDYYSQGEGYQSHRHDYNCW